MKIVLTRHLEHDFDSVWIAGEKGSFNFSDEYTQVSEIIDVEFPMLDIDLNMKKVEAIDKQISKAEAGIHLLKQAKAELLAIPNMSASQ